MGRSTLHATAFHILRLIPAAGFLLFGTFPPFLTGEDLRVRLTAFLILVSLLIVWGMAEGTFILWHKSRITGPQGDTDKRGYLLVTGILAFCMLPLLQLFRLRVTQEIFILTLATLSLRGLSRSAWEQNRENIATAACWTGFMFLTALSFGLLKHSLLLPPDWQLLLVAVSVGAPLLALESTWYARSTHIESVTKWQLPLFRIALFIGPVLVGFLVFMGQLPLCYLSLYGAVLLAQKGSKRVSQRGFLSRDDVPFVLLYAGVFFALLGVCRAYEGGWFR